MKLMLEIWLCIFPRGLEAFADSQHDSYLSDLLITFIPHTPAYNKTPAS